MIKDKELRKLVRKKWSDRNNSMFRHIKSILSSMPHKSSYRILGYGSLLNKESTLSTMPNAVDKGFLLLNGYRRIFNMGYINQGFLNIEKADNQIVVRVWELSILDFIKYLIREGNYTFIEEDEGWICIGQEWDENITPNLNYLRTCISDLSSEDKENFWKSTYNANGELTLTYLNKLWRK